jgi:hypothetical protein
MKIHKCLYILCILSVSAIFQAYVEPVQAQSGNNTNTSAETSDRPMVMMLKPVVAFHDYNTDVVMPGKDYGLKEEEYAVQLSEYAIKIIQNNAGIEPAEEQIINFSSQEVLNLLEKEATKLARGLISDESCDSLKKAVADMDVKQPFILVQYLKMKGGRKSVDLLIPAGFKTMLAHSSLISCKSCEVVWQNKVFIRKLPSPKSNDFNRLLTDLFKGFSITSNGGLNAK